jgi:alkanesulfonate monooxygenase SsuD/methylene tetrahydromethanopterin reductase-like flavin-dependent oxidoreductase (luciferase family)
MKFGILTLSDHYPEDKSEEQYYSAQSVEIAAAYHGFVDETPEQARRKWEAHYMRYLRFVATLIAPPEEIPAEQYESWRRLGEGIKHVTFEQMYPNLVLCGDPAQCVDRIGILQEELGVTHFQMYMDLGGLDHGELMGSMGRFATKVIPHFRT